MSGFFGRSTVIKAAILAFGKDLLVKIVVTRRTSGAEGLGASFSPENAKTTGPALVPFVFGALDFYRCCKKHGNNLSRFATCGLPDAGMFGFSHWTELSRGVICAIDESTDFHCWLWLGKRVRSRWFSTIQDTIVYALEHD
jgi:hypothetical protein